MTYWQQYKYGVVGSSRHLPPSGSAFQEEFHDDPDGQKNETLFDARTSGTHLSAGSLSASAAAGGLAASAGSAVPSGGHRHNYSAGSSLGGLGEAQGLLRNIDGGETSGQRYTDDVVAAYQMHQRYASASSGASLGGAGAGAGMGGTGSTGGTGQTVDEEGRVGGRPMSRATTLSEYPPTPSSRNFLLPEGAARPATPGAVQEDRQLGDDDIGLGFDFGGGGERDAQGQGQGRSGGVGEAPKSPEPRGKSGLPLVPLNPD